MLQGVRAVLAESYEKIHKAHLVGIGIAPLQFLPGESAETLGLTGRETFSLAFPEELSPGVTLTMKVPSPGRRACVVCAGRRCTGGPAVPGACSDVGWEREPGRWLGGLAGVRSPREGGQQGTRPRRRGVRTCSRLSCWRFCPDLTFIGQGATPPEGRAERRVRATGFQEGGGAGVWAIMFDVNGHE